MGMKAAACWFSDLWCVRTKALGESVERTVRFDIGAIVSNRTETLGVEERPAAPGEHYTIITLERLGAKFPQARTQKKLKDHLSSIYRVFMRRGDIELLWDRDAEPLHYPGTAVLESPAAATPDAPALEWRKAVDVDFGHGKRIHGFAALRAEGSTTHAGFALFRRNRLIIGSDDEPFRPLKSLATPTATASSDCSANCTWRASRSPTPRMVSSGTSMSRRCSTSSAAPSRTSR